ncbi:MAG: SMP-30/gluconolactonase/LRE family protein [Gammaproteobacteria bacterium]|nr:SMP-30/gluconolactonase/LRE family protein [Gammaproteobacteria bacterium]
MRKVLLVLGAVIALAALYLLAWPVPIKPVAWQAPASAGYTGAHASNERLAQARLVSIAPEVGPEHIEFGPDGMLYTGTLSGAVLRLDPAGGSPQVVTRTAGRPLGLAFDANGQLLIADAMRGLLAVDAAGTARVLTDSVDGTPILFADAVVVASDGKVLLTDATQRISPREYGTFDAALFDILEHSCTGRVLEFDPAGGSTRVVAQGLCFPNGVALSADEQSLLIAETGTYRVLKVARSARGLDAGEALRTNAPGVAVVIDNLPGFPDNLTRGADGRYWTGFTKPRSATIDKIAGKPWLRALTLRLPRSLWPVPPAYGHVIAFDEQGKVLLDLQDPAGKLPETSGATEHEGQLYVQSLHATTFGMLPLSAAAAPPRSP